MVFIVFVSDVILTLNVFSFAGVWCDSYSDGSGHHDSSPSAERLFCAFDNLSSSCAFAPPGFRLGGFVSHSWRTHDTFLLPDMWASVEVEILPPRVGSRRTRVLVFERGVAMTNGGVGRGGVGAGAKGGSGPLTVAVVGSKK